MDFATADLCDAHLELLEDGRLAVLPPLFRLFGQRVKFAGPAVTLKVFEDNALVRATLEGPGHGNVLVVAKAPVAGRAKTRLGRRIGHPAVHPPPLHAEVPCVVQR